MINHFELARYLNDLLEVDRIQDYAPNGLQVEGRATIKKIVTGVAASQELIDHAIHLKADAILVHHGYFWKNENPCLTHMKKKRIASLLKHDINLYAYHLPLDLHPTLGNNAQLAERLGFEITGQLPDTKPKGLVMLGHLSQTMTAAELSVHLTQHLQRQPLVIQGHDRPIHSVAWCTGSAQDFLEEVALSGVDAYITGEVSERTTYVAREMGIHFFAAGHHATERYGVQALGRHLDTALGLEHVFVEVDNPV